MSVVAAVVFWTAAGTVALLALITAVVGVAMALHMLVERIEASLRMHRRRAEFWSYPDYEPRSEQGWADLERLEQIASLRTVRDPMRRRARVLKRRSGRRALSRTSTRRTTR